MSQNKLKEACDLMEEYLPEAKLVYSPIDTIIAFDECMLSNMYKKQGDIENAIKWGNKSLNSYKRQGYIGEIYKYCLSNMASMYEGIGKIDSAIECYQQMYELEDSIGDKYTHNHAQTGYLLGCLFYKYKKGGKGIDILQNVILLYDSPKMKIDSLYLAISQALSLQYYSKGNIVQSMKVWENVTQNIKKRIGDDNLFYLNAIIKYANQCHIVGKDGKAYEIFSNELNVLQSLNLSEKHLEGLNILAGILRDIGDLKQSISLFSKAKKIYEDNDYTSKMDYAYLLLDMAYLYQEIHDTINCVSICKDIIDLDSVSKYLDFNHVILNAKYILAEMYEDTNPTYSATLCEEILIADGNVDISFDYPKEMAIYKIMQLRILHPENYEIEQSYNRLSSRKFLIVSEKKLEALNNLGHFLIGTAKSQENRESFVNANQNLIQTEVLREIFNDFKEKTIGNILFLTEKQREMYYDKTLKEYHYPNLLAHASDYMNNDELNGIVYDFLLFTKSILLTTNIGISTIVYDSGDQELIKKLEDFKEHNYKYDKETIELKEREILMQVRNLSDFTVDLQQSWENVRQALKENEMAMEVLVNSNNGFNEYFVLMLKKDWENPKIFNLSLVEEAINRFGFERMANIWKILIDEGFINIGDTIFMSGAGIFQTKPFEHLEVKPGIYFSDLCHVVRVTSTREIVKQRGIVEPIRESLILFGGLDYDKSEMTNTNETYEDISLFRGEGDDRYRFGFEKLMYSQKEVDYIQSIANNKNFNCRKYCGKNGTEHEVKNLSGENICVLHFATHGLYYPKTYPSATTDSPYQQLFNTNDCLNRSFLVMAGGNALPQHKNVKDSSVDGLLTASEISKLDFHNVSFVVLSACQSAKGDISNEGVLGLQYGFKKAGVNSILMCLDNIDDKATQILMVEFYKNFLSGKSKYDSLRDAQRFLRTTENGKYNDPKYWASFILLDAID